MGKVGKVGFHGGVLQKEQRQNICWITTVYPLHANSSNSPEFAVASNQAIVLLRGILTNTVAIKQKQLHCKLALPDDIYRYHSTPNKFVGMQQ